MTNGLFMFVLLIGLFALARSGLDYWTLYQISYGAFSLMAAMISLTFLWLWAGKQTPLALGMSFSWAGAASVMGWWWVYTAFGRPAQLDQSQLLFVFLSLYFVGAFMHFSVILERAHAPRAAVLIPVCASLLISILVHSLI
ncbi:MAG: hypothetical protein ACR2OY_10855 [Boseongicola sp.]